MLPEQNEVQPFTPASGGHGNPANSMPSDRTLLGSRRAIDATRRRITSIFESENFELNLDRNTAIQSAESCSQPVICHEQELSQFDSEVVVVRGVVERIIRPPFEVLGRVFPCRVEKTDGNQLH